MYISPKTAQNLFADLTRNAQVPLTPDEFTRPRRGGLSHDHVFVGDLAVRRYKHHGHWKYLEREVRQAGQSVAGLMVDVDDVVEVQLSDAGLVGERRPDWRGQVGTWVFALARAKTAGEPLVSRQDEPPGVLEWQDVRACTYSIAGTLPLQLLNRSRGRWLFPRAYVELMDRWQEQEEELAGHARICRDCGALGPADGAWRTLENSGYVTRCPPCSAAALPCYSGQLDGRTYRWARESRHRADEYLCQGCGSQRAWAWDHCHSHRFIRGPLCGSCNTSEGDAGFSETFLRHDGAGKHLMQCRGCRERQTLPAEHHRGVVHRHVERTVRHGTCQEQPSVWPLATGPTAYKYRLVCQPHDVSWEVMITTKEAATLVNAFVECALTEIHGNPGDLAA